MVRHHYFWLWLTTEFCPQEQDRESLGISPDLQTLPAIPPSLVYQGPSLLIHSKHGYSSLVLPHHTLLRQLRSDLQHLLLLHPWGLIKVGLGTPELNTPPELWRGLWILIQS